MEQSKFAFTGILFKDNEADQTVCALCTELDVASEGETIVEAKNNLVEAVTLYIESAVENNLPVLRPVPNEENPLIKNPDQILEKFTLKINFKVYAHA
jgi:predicted RNase H-like HicB family nuclease